jgi:hypothetical protein
MPAFKINPLTTALKFRAGIALGGIEHPVPACTGAAFQ